MVRSDHELPFQSSLKGALAVLCVSLTPAAMHQVGDTQLMPDALGTGVEPLAVGVAALVRDSAVPFHWLPKTTLLVPSNAVPRVWQTPAATHDTEESVPPVSPVGRATVTFAHAFPFHVSATGPVPLPPTARQNDEPTHETDARVSSVVEATSVLGTTLHDVPFHCSVSVPPPAPTFCPPTAMQKVPLVQATSASVLVTVVEAAAACVSDHCSAPTVGGLDRPAAPAAGARSAPAEKETSAPAMAISSPKRRISLLLCFGCGPPEGGRPVLSGSGLLWQSATSPQPSIPTIGGVSNAVARAGSKAAWTPGAFARRARRPSGLATRKPNAATTASATRRTTPSQIRLPAWTNNAAQLEPGRK